MNIDFQDKGAVATMTITSSVFEFRRHNRAVDAALFREPGIIHTRSGLFRMKTVISGPSNRMLRAYKIAQKDVQK
ncbi:hypothetical protein AAIG33_11265 [Phytobacter ursingii]|uniref:hypothetical protein n=1 Tax=Phytobacter ursingii TaxID=1972431 RepID=UPI000CD11B05|nr:hypothetical protein C2U51_05790 [Enterobacteriaceae bacterium ENNIH1]